MHALGSDRAAIEHAIAKSRQNPAALSVPVTVSVSGDRLTDCAAGRRAGRGREVWVWALAKAVTVAVTRGENNGRTITYHNVARRFVDLGAWNAPPTLERAAARYRRRRRQSAAVLVQTGTAEKPGLMLGATPWRR